VHKTLQDGVQVTRVAQIGETGICEFQSIQYLSWRVWYFRSTRAEIDFRWGL